MFRVFITWLLEFIQELCKNKECQNIVLIDNETVTTYLRLIKTIAWKACSKQRSLFILPEVKRLNKIIILKDTCLGI